MNIRKYFDKLRIGTVILFLLLVVFGGTITKAESAYVVDNVNLFSDIEIEELTRRATSLEESKSARVMLYVDENFPVDDAFAFAEQKYREYRLPENGAIIVLATSGEIAASSNNPKIAEKVNVALDMVMPLLEEGKITEALFELQGIFIEYFGGKKEEVVINVVEADNLGNVETSVSDVVSVEVKEENEKSAEESREDDDTRNLPLLIITIVSMSGCFIMAFLLVEKTRKAEESSIVAEQEIKILSESFEQFKSESNEILERQRKIYIDHQNVIEDLKRRLQNSQNEIQNYERNLEIIRIIHPNIVEEMENYYRRKQEEADKAKAEEFDFACGKIIKDSITKELVEPLQNILRQYSSLSDSQKQWVRTDCNLLKENLQKAEELKRQYEAEMEERRCQSLARQFENSIRYLQQSAHLLDLEERNTRVENLLKHYRNEMPKQACDMIDIAQMQAWTMFYKNIQREWQQELERREELRRRREEEERRERARREEEERRRREQKRREEEERRRMSSSSSSFSSSRSSSGGSRSFGGSSSGGSRSFGGGKSRGGGAGRSF